MGSPSLYEKTLQGSCTSNPTLNIREFVIDHPPTASTDFMTTQGATLDRPAASAECLRIASVVAAAAEGVGVRVLQQQQRVGDFAGGALSSEGFLERPGLGIGHAAQAANLAGHHAIILSREGKAYGGRAKQRLEPQRPLRKALRRKSKTKA